MISGRKRAGPGASLLISVIFGGCWGLFSSADLLVPDLLPSARPLAYTVRLPSISKLSDPKTGEISLQVGQKLYARGQTLTPEQLRTVQSYRKFRSPPTMGSLIAVGLFNALLIFIFSSFLRATGGAAALVRTQLVMITKITGLILIGKMLLVFTAWSPTWIPAVALTILFGVCVGRKVAVGITVLGAVALSLLDPFNLPLFLVLLAQGLTASAVIRHRRRGTLLLAATALSAAAGALAHLGVQLFLFERGFSLGALAQGSIDLGALLGSDLVGSTGSAIVGGLLAMVALPITRLLMGQVSKARLTTLADFDHPLLQQLANDAPGTWAHSTNMANMAEMAANQIGADGLLVRVGAYYHDIGKCPYSGYFVENQQGDNPHDKMDPESSAGVIRAHVTDGIELAREHGLPQAIVEFIFTHHGRDRLEYFWHKAQSSESPQAVDAAFRYTGIPPQTREQGILSLCDAVEAASHTLKGPDTEQIDQLVRQIVFSKLRSGVFDSSGLGVRELRLITDSLIDSLRNSLHARVKYPWQEKGDESRPPAGSSEEEQAGAVIPLTKKRPQR